MRNFKFGCILNLVFLAAMMKLPASAAWAIETSVVRITSEAVEESLKARRIVLMIGVSHFEDPFFSALTYPKKDVDDFNRFLLNNNRSPQDDYIVLKDANATLDVVQRALDELEAKNTSEDDIVMVYLTTHGTLGAGNADQWERFAVLHDTDHGRLRQSGLSIDYLQSRLGRFRSQKKALILALCHSGSGKSELPEEVIKQLARLKAAQLPSIYRDSSAMMVLSASAWGEAAREDDQLQNDVYTLFAQRPPRKRQQRRWRDYTVRSSRVRPYQDL